MKHTGVHENDFTAHGYQVEFAKELIDRGCTITFDGHRRQLQDILDEIKGTQSGAPLMQLQVVASAEECPFDSVYGDTYSDVRTVKNRFEPEI